MSNIEEELKSFLHENIRSNDQKNRDIALILFFFGFHDEAWPTLEEAALKFGVGDSEKRRSERPRQIIQNKFTSKVNISMLPKVQEVSRIFELNTRCTLSMIEGTLNKENLLPKNYSLKGILNLLQQLGVCKNFNIYTNKLIPATRISVNSENNLYLLRNDEVKILKLALKKLTVYPGLVGVASWKNFLLKNIECNDYRDLLLDVMRSRDDVWLKTVEGELYYTIEDRDNTLVNNLEKIKNIADTVELQTLAIVLSNAFKSRTAPKGNAYPSINIIEQYLTSSRYTTYDGKNLKLNVEPSILRDIESDVISIMKAKEEVNFVEAKHYLESKGYTKPSIDKAILNSTLVHADKSLRKSYKYRLISNSKFINSEYMTRYSLFKEKLIKICSDGSDANIESYRRKEQQILRDWLFDGKDVESCAICDKEFSVSSLITAHKKKRSECSFNERIDPNIVMPLCKFGCDHLYEIKVLRIQKNIVISNNKSKQTVFEQLYIKAVSDRPIKSKWSDGEAEYFI